MLRVSALLLLSAFLAPRASSAVIEWTAGFDAPRIESAQGYDRVVFDQTFPAGKIGGPALPFRSIRLLLPPGEGVTSVELSTADPVEIPGTYRLYPQQPVRPVFHAGAALVVDPAATTSAVPLPEESTPRLHTRFANGLSIATGAFTPLLYVPKTGRVSYYPRVTLRVHTAPSPEARAALDLLPFSPEILRSLAAALDNPEAVEAYRAKEKRGEGGSASKAAEGDFRVLRGEEGGGEGALRDDFYEYLIITRQSFIDDFQPLALHYLRRGIRTRIVSVESIDASYSGVDQAARVRECIRDAYENHGIRWVLLGGDADGPPDDPSGKVVPYRGLFCQVHSSMLYEDPSIPGDCYFAGLDGNWNTDGDSRWGEPGEEDFYGEVGVGRAPVDSETEIATFILKTIRYQDAPVTGDARRTLLLGEYLWETPPTWGGDYMDELAGLCTTNGFTTNGIPPSYPIQKLYEKTGSWNMYDLFAAVNSGIHMIHHLGHSNTWYNMKMNIADVSDANLANDGVNHGYCVVYTQGCLAGAFDNFDGDYSSTDAIGEKMLTIQHFAAAAMANSRFGWFTEGSTNGPSQHYHREFTDALFSEGITTIGEANTRSKSETVPFIDLPDEYEPGAHRWCFYCMNLLGDPAMDLWTDTPLALNVSAPDSLSAEATALTVETGVSGALAAASRDGELYGRAYADEGGHAEIGFTQPIAGLGALDLVVTAHNRLVYEKTIVVGDAPVSVAEGDGEAAPGDSGSGPLLEAIGPVPFSSGTVLRYTVPQASIVSLRVFDAGGRLVARLVQGLRDAGVHQVEWTPDARLAPGVYLCELRVGDATEVRRLVRLR